MLLFIGAILLITISYNCGKSYSCESFNNYYNATETLLDSIYVHDEVFMDVLAETDAYDNYITSRNNLKYK